MSRPAQDKHRFDVILLFLLTMYFVLAFMPGPLGTVLAAACIGLSWVWVFRGESHQRGLFWARSITLGICLLLVASGFFATGLKPLGLLYLAFVAAIVGLPLLILHRILNHSSVTAQTIMGAICVHLLMGLAFTFLYIGLDRVMPMPLFGTHLISLPDCLYFSFVTLTSLGFGDISPVTPVGKALVPLEALLGQTYLATLVARLVGLMASRSKATS